MTSTDPHGGGGTQTQQRRPTRQRRAVAAALAGFDDFRSAQEIHDLISRQGDSVGLATVYRVLAQFEQTGLLKKSQLGNNKAVYELNDRERHHGHLVCTKTGDVLEFFDPEIENRLKVIAAELGYELSDYVVTAFGARR